MALSTFALKLKKYLGIYNITAKNYNSRINGAVLYENLYSPQKFNDNFGGLNRTRSTAAPQHGLFKTALADLITAGY